MNKAIIDPLFGNDINLSQDPNWWRGAVIYQVYPRSFQDSNGDGVGDLAGITSRLGYIAELGVDAIWVSPFFTSPMKDFGYDVSNYCDVDPLFGTLADFDHLIEEAHHLGLKVMIDQVLSHTSSQHPWFEESRKAADNAKSDWYVWADAKPDGSPPNNWLSIFGGSAWEWDTTRCQYFLHNFLAEQPDLNFHNSEVQDALLETVKFWLERGVDGFRLDTVNFFFHSQGLENNPALPADQRDFTTAPRVNPYNYQSHRFDKSRPENIDFLRRFRALLDLYPGTTSVGEVGDAEHQLGIMADYTSGNDKLHMCYTFDFLSSLFTAGHFQDRIAKFEEIVGDGWACWAFSNHDVQRHITRWTEDADLSEQHVNQLAKTVASLLLCLRGSVCLYQGEELGFPEADIAFKDLADPYGIRFWPKFKGRDGCRTPMAWQSDAINSGFSQNTPWLPLSHEHVSRAVDTQSRDDQSVLMHYRQFLKLRQRHTALKTGSIELFKSPDHSAVLAFKRAANEAVLCVFNLSDKPISWPIPAGIKVARMEDDAHNIGHNSRCDDTHIHLNQYDAFIGHIE
ncbi:MAG: alpha glucosidase [Rhizobiales bacterium]|nr:alpha glucosidase [Hyphomicrobiales bacterium]